MLSAVSVVSLPGGRTAEYTEIGEGEPLLVFTGGPGLDAAAMQRHAELLETLFRSYVIEPPGSGRSSPPDDPSGYDHLGHARFYDEVRRALGLERVSVLGWSFGGTVALTYAAEYPDVVDRCIAVAPFAFGTDVDQGEAAAEMQRLLERHRDAEWYPEAIEVWDNWTERALAAEDAVTVEDMFRRALPLYAADPSRPAVAEEIEHYGASTRVNLDAVKAWEGGLYQSIDLRPLLPRVRARTLVVVGQLDPIAGPAQARAIAEALPRATIRTLPARGHLVAIEDAAGYCRAVMAWYAGDASA
jgi:pimeloyl-ACP methyl ester carboxylesterase